MENVICLNQVEIDTILPDGRLEKAKELLGDHVYCNPESFAGDEEWIKLLEEKNPEVILAAWKTPSLPDNILEIAPNLKYVCYLAGSIRKLVPRAAVEQGLLVSNWSSSVSRTVSECALLLILSCMRRSRYWTTEMHLNGGWKNPAVTTTQSLFERRVGLHGFGLISQMLADLLKPFGNTISAFSPRVPDEVFEEHGIERSESLEDLFANNDVIVELAALTPSNVGMITEELLRSIPEGGAFVNVGRGAVVDEEALGRVAKERPDLQIGLDVYGIEPLPKDSPFRGQENIMLLPHLGGPTTDRRKDAGDHGLANLERFGNGETIVDPIDLGMYDRAT